MNRLPKATSRSYEKTTFSKNEHNQLQEMGSSQHLYSAIERILCVFDWTDPVISNETFS
jgi:hypothetical protein